MPRPASRDEASQLADRALSATIDRPLPAVVLARSTLSLGALPALGSPFVREMQLLADLSYVDAESCCLTACVLEALPDVGGCDVYTLVYSR